LLITRNLAVTNEFLATFFDMELYQADELLCAFAQAEMLEEDEDGVLCIKNWENTKNQLIYS